MAKAMDGSGGRPKAGQAERSVFIGGSLEADGLKRIVWSHGNGMKSIPAGRGLRENLSEIIDRARPRSRELPPADRLISDIGGLPGMDAEKAKRIMDALRSGGLLFI
jgi:hypothetical protein